VPEDGSWSALEAGAVERIIARCANACEALCVERRGPTAMVEPTQIPPSVAYFDVRVAAPIALTLGVAIVRELPETPPQVTVSAATIGSIALEVRVILGRGSMPVPCLLELRPGSVVSLGTKVDDAGELNVAGQRIGLGTCGLRNSRSAFEVQSITMRGDPW
jgi:flagellar motor switch/type III secretory pathway protein FliN